MRLRCSLIICISLSLVINSTVVEEIDPWEDLEDGMLAETFDPVEEMRKLLELEIAEGESFKKSLRDEGVDVEHWEKEFNKGHLEL